jgi:hypothetical protein
MFKKREIKKRTFTVAEFNDRNDDERLEKPEEIHDLKIE